ncbi:MAG: serine/threonine protein kinase [Clostridia bacterium]|nr:serine/threonine protein kinase [Clostridia bacterium]
MSRYEEFIKTTLDNDYSHIKCVKNEDTAKIDVFKHNNSENRLVLIYSKNRNDHIFRILKGVIAPNLPVIYDVCSCEDHLLILESYVEGKTLADILALNPPSTKQALKYSIQICEALSILHSKQIIHRDIKPDNVIITPEDNAVLIDLSASRLLTDNERKDTVSLGTVGYAAPEQYGIHQSTPPTDIYALGVLINELMLGCHPTIKTPSGKLGKIIKKCTETQIYNRYQSADKLMSDLKKIKRL